MGSPNLTIAVTIPHQQQCNSNCDIKTTSTK